jgi:hypothetical protein
MGFDLGGEPLDFGEHRGGIRPIGGEHPAVAAVSGRRSRRCGPRVEPGYSPRADATM